MVSKWFKSDCKLAAEPKNIFQLTHHRFYSTSSPAWQSIYFTALGAFRQARDNTSTEVLPDVSKTAYSSGNFFLAKPELLKCLPVRKCQAFCSWCEHLSQFNILPSDFFSSIILFPITVGASPCYCIGICTRVCLQHFQIIYI